MTTRKVFGAAEQRSRGHSLNVFGHSQVKQTCGCCGGVAVNWGTFMPELGITMPHYQDWKALCQACRHGLTALAWTTKIST